MLRRISIICTTLVVASTGIFMDTQTAEAQLFRRLRARIESRIPAPPPVQLQRQPFQPQTLQRQSATQPRIQPQGQRVSPVAPQPTPAKPIAPQSGSNRAAKPPTGANAGAKRFGGSILAPAQSPQPASNPTQELDTAVAASRSAAKSAPRRASLGIDVRQLKGAIPGLTVVKIKDTSGADEAGLQVGDLIIAVDGKATPTIPDINQLLSGRKGGDYIRARIVRDRTTEVLMLPLTGDEVASAKPSTSPTSRLTEGPIEFGIEIAESNGQQGVIVADVADNSPAAAAGLQVGDRIVSLDGRLLSAADVLSRELAKLKLGDELNLQVVRDGKLVAADVQMVDPATLATNLTKQKPAEGASVLGSFGSALSGLLNGNSKSKADSAKDQMAFDDDEPVEQVVFESEIEGDPPSLQTLELPPGVAATPIETGEPQQQAPQRESSEDLREQIRRLQQQLRDLEAEQE